MPHRAAKSRVRTATGLFIAMTQAGPPWSGFLTRKKTKLRTKSRPLNSNSG